MDASTQKSLRKYFFVYVVAFVGYSAIFGTIQILWDTPGLSGIRVILPYFSSWFVIERFLKNEQRLPDKSEQIRLANGCIAIAIGFEVSFLLLGLVSGALKQAVDQSGISSTLFWAIIIIVLVFMLVLNYFLLRWAFNGQAKKRAIKLGIIPSET